MTKRIFFAVAFTLPAGATPAMARKYVQDALLSECGALHPDDPMSDFDRKSVVVHQQMLLVP